MRTFINGENSLTVIQDWQPHCWINIECPTLEELNYLTDELQIPQSFLNDIEDPDERPRIDHEAPAHHGPPFSTVPLGIILRGDIIVTLCYHQNDMIADFISYNQRKNRGFTNKYNLVLRLLLSSSVWFLKYLKQLNIQVKRAEKKLERSIKNRELQALLHIEKCFVFFITSINGNFMLLQRLKNIKSDIKEPLTSASIVLMIPTLIASFYGMNVPNSLEGNPLGFVIIVVFSMLIACGVFWFLRRRNGF